MSLLVQNRNQYEYAFRLLVADFLRICEFIEPVNENLIVYSHRLYELLLRSCTEFESICREVLKSEGYKKKTGNLGIADYVHIEPTLQLRKQSAIITFWRPAPIDLILFKEWTPEAPSLEWYRAYNAVKHNRNIEFSNANFRNVRDSLTSLFIILARLKIIDNDGRHRSKPGGEWSGTFTFEGLPFGLPYAYI